MINNNNSKLTFVVNKYIKLKLEKGEIEIDETGLYYA